MWIDIDDLGDPRLEPYRHLKDTNRTRWAGLLVAEGEKLVARLLASDFEVASVLLSRRYAPDWAARVPPQVSMYVIPDGMVETLVGFNFHRGILACARRKPPPDVHELLARRGDQATLVVCPDVQDPENLGGMLRLAAAFGIDAVLLGGAAADPFSRRVLRVSMGAALALPILVTDRLRDVLCGLQQAWGLECWATLASPQAEPLGSALRPRRLALLFGSEGHGLAADWRALCRRHITIPMRGGVDSLNVVVAAGICLYHLAQPQGAAAARELSAGPTPAAARPAAW